VAGFFAILSCSTSFCFANGISGESFQQTSSRHLYILYPGHCRFPFVPEWVERQFQKVCELWGYTADSLLKGAQLRLQNRLKTVADAPGWLKSSALPRITLVYTKLAYEYEKSIARCLGIDVDELLEAWHEWLAEAEITESVWVWRSSEKSHLKARADFLSPLMGPVRYRWVKGLLDRIPSSGTWETLRNCILFWRIRSGRW
jgi:hypothetical protein